MKAIGIQYNAKLQRIARQVKRDIDATIMPLVRRYATEYTQDAAPVITSDAWPDAIQSAMQALLARWASDQFVRIADSIAATFVRTALAKSERDMKKSTGIDVFSGSSSMQDYLKASAQQNAQLIKSIPADYLAQVSTLVTANMRSGMRPGYIERALQEQFGVTQRRAKFIARDQTGKIQGELAERQQRGAGFDYFQWIDSDDSRVRERHAEIAEKVTAYGPGVYRWDNLPLSDKGVPIKPGSDYSCRCTSRPVSAREVQENQKAGRVNPGVYR